jgi:hypothetical protein
MLHDLRMLQWLKKWGWTVAFFAALGVGIPRAAVAQTCPNISISVNPTVNRYLPGSDNNRNLFPFRNQNLQPTWINYNDCKSDINLEFTILISGLPCTDTIQVWAGTVDCTQVAARQNDSGQTHCWPVTPTGSFNMSATSTGNIRAQDIVQFITNAAPPETYTRAAPTACQSQDAPGGVSLGLYFMAIEADGQTVDGTSAEYDMGADLIGPYPPSNVVAGIGEDLIVVSWDPAVDSTIQGFNIYCEDQGATAGDTGLDAPLEATLVCADTGVAPVDTGLVDGLAVDSAATMVDAGCRLVDLRNSGGPGGSACVSNVLVNEFEIGATAAVADGEAIATEASAEVSTANTAVGISDIPGKYLCGQVGGNTTSNFVVEGFSDGGPAIVDGTQYAVTVAATDGTGNTGIIGNLSCVTPQPVMDFWTEYTNAGGLGGNGFCALQGPGMPVSGSLMGIGMGAIGIGYMRRRRRRR